MGWAADEFDGVDLGDKRLDARLVKLCDSLSEAPESPINQACEDWHETKAAYRFFQNENVDIGQIISAHRRKTVERVAPGVPPPPMADPTLLRTTTWREAACLKGATITSSSIRLRRAAKTK